jgi:hypothetical protein
MQEKKEESQEKGCIEARIGSIIGFPRDFIDVQFHMKVPTPHEKHVAQTIQIR